MYKWYLLLVLTNPKLFSYLLQTFLWRLSRGCIFSQVGSTLFLLRNELVNSLTKNTAPVLYCYRLKARIGTPVTLSVLTVAHVVVSSDQAWSTSGPRATFGPRSTLMLPASCNFSIIDSHFYKENMLTILKICNWSLI